MQSRGFRSGICDIPVMAVKVTALAALGALAGGCTLHEQVLRPPTAADIARINETSASTNSWLRVEYVEPIASAQSVRVWQPAAIAAADVDRIDFRTREGAVQSVPTALVKGVTVKERPTGAAWGAGIGLASGAALFGAVYFLATHVIPHDEGSSSNWDCDRGCFATRIVPTVAVVGAIGGLIGYAIGARRTFEFAGGP
jgi:hypothetical protein